MVGLSNNGKPQLDDWPDPGPQEVHAAARHILGCDLSVIRVMADGSKMPAGAWKQYQETKPSLDDLARWFGSGAAYAIGIPCGKASGNLEVIDVEGTDVCDV
ncbi:MAG TPA: bifunctional DNA primase/polymerase, partial [Candidatus Saccharimonadales bacterium]|nr:bifunctional DNA primase/polymerase [Candidatus Saccharimonadales bacterium]